MREMFVVLHKGGGKCSYYLNYYSELYVSTVYSSFIHCSDPFNCLVCSAFAVSCRRTAVFNSFSGLCSLFIAGYLLPRYIILSFVVCWGYGCEFVWVPLRATGLCSFLSIPQEFLENCGIIGLDSNVFCEHFDIPVWSCGERSILFYFLLVLLLQCGYVDTEEGRA